MRILIIVLILSMTTLCYAEKYAVKLEDGKLASWMVVSDEYIEKFKDDPTNPLNQGFVLVDDISGYEVYEHPKVTERGRILKELGVSEDDLARLKTLLK